MVVCMRRAPPQAQVSEHQVPSPWCCLQGFRWCGSPEGSTSLGAGFESLQPGPTSHCSLCFLHVLEDVRSQLSALTNSSHASSTLMNSPSGTVRQTNSSVGCLCRGVLPQQHKVINTQENLTYQATCVLWESLSKGNLHERIGKKERGEGRERIYIYYI